MQDYKFLRAFRNYWYILLNGIKKVWQDGKVFVEFYIILVLMMVIYALFSILILAVDLLTMFILIFIYIIIILPFSLISSSGTTKYMDVLIDAYNDYCDTLIKLSLLEVLNVN